MKNSDTLKKSGADVLRAALIALLISLIGVLILALIVRWASLDDTPITIGNYVIKALSLVAGVLLGFKTPSNGAAKGALTGLLYMLLCMFVFAVADGFKSANFNYVDLITTVIAGTVAGIIAVNVRVRKTA